MTLTKRILLGFILLYLMVVSGTVSISFITIRKEVHNEMLAQYLEYFRLAELNLNIFFDDIQGDLMTLSGNPHIRTRKEDEFTTFLVADENTFQYNYTDEELEIIQLFNNYRMNHPYVNSVYMGRENGSFVRSHPRTSPTQYDPRERPWYQLAQKNPYDVQVTQAYTSVTNSDINIGSVVALMDEYGEVFGVIGIDVTINVLSDEMAKMRLKYDGRMELWDAEKTIIVSSERDKLNTKGNISKDYSEVASNSQYSLMSNTNDYRIIYPTKHMSGQLVAYIPADKVEQVIYDTVKKRVAFITLIIVSVAVFTFLLIEVIVLRPIRKMRGALRFSRVEALPQIMDIKAVGEIRDFQIEYNELVRAIENDKSEIEKVKLLTITSLVSLAEIRDNETGLHIIRTQKYLELLAITFNQMYLDKAINENKLSIMVQCAPLHDIGKVAIPDHILLKPGKLTPEEFEIMKLHTVYGKDTIRKGKIDDNDSMFINTVINIVYCHHERWDGSGYPQGQAGETIPIEARIMAVADVYDALTTKRIYKEAIGHEEAIDIMKAGEGTQFDPDIIRVLLKVEKTFKAISEVYCEE